MIQVLGLTLHIYGLLIGVAIYVAWEVSKRMAVRKKIPVKVIDDMAWLLIVFGIIGARIYHVIDYWNRYYKFEPSKIFFLWEGGLGIWGAVIGGLVGLLVYQYYFRLLSKNKRVNIFDLLDCVSVGMPIAQAIGRLGNWVNGELYGKNGEPLFAYEALLNIGLFFLLWRMSAKKNVSGKIFGLYLIGYGLIRIFLENFRPDNEIWKILSLPTAIWIGIVSVLIGIYLYRFRVRPGMTSK
jgi:phosphatidylglycerol:prolipoprotein diacylglycerol transferase